MRARLALAATVGTLALAPPAGEELRSARPPIVQLGETAKQRLVGRQITFGGALEYAWVETWQAPPLYAADRPVVERSPETRAA
jgi:hypothetical protein